MSAWAKPGVKCVCVSRWGGNKRPYLPKLMQVYTVEFVDWTHEAGPMMELVEIASKSSTYKFPINCFRPLITRSQEDDVRLIKSLLVADEVDA